MSELCADEVAADRPVAVDGLGNCLNTWCLNMDAICAFGRMVLGRDACYGAVVRSYPSRHLVFFWCIAISVYIQACSTLDSVL